MAVSSSKHAEYKPTQGRRSSDQKSDQSQNTKRVTPFSIDDILSAPKNVESRTPENKTNSYVGEEGLSATHDFLPAFYSWQQNSYSQWIDNLRRLYAVTGLEPLLQAGGQHAYKYRGTCRRRSSSNVLHGKGVGDFGRKSTRTSPVNSAIRRHKVEEIKTESSRVRSEATIEITNPRRKRKLLENGECVSLPGSGKAASDSKTEDVVTSSDSPLHALEKLTCSTLQYLETKQPSLHTVAVGQEVRSKRRKCRTAFSTFQLSVLEQRFNCHKYLTPSDRDHIARALGLSASQVITWFQNRRAKLKRDIEELQNDIKTVR